MHATYSLSKLTSIISSLMGDSAMEEGRWNPFKPGEKVTGGVWEGSLFGDSNRRTEGEDGVGVD